MAQVVDADLALLLIVEGHEVQRGEVARRVVEEHVFRAGIGGADLPVLGQVCQSLIVVWNWRPGSAQSHAAVAMRSQISRAFTFCLVFPSVRFTSSHQSVVEHRLHEGVGETKRVVRGLAAHRVVRLAVPVGGVLLRLEVPDALRRRAGSPGAPRRRAPRPGAPRGRRAPGSLFLRGSKLARRRRRRRRLRRAGGTRPGCASCAGGGSCCR